MVSINRIPIAICERHVHLRQETIERLFGAGHRLQVHSLLSQPGLFVAQEKVALLGPRGRLENVKVLGPARAADQVEITRTDEFLLGVRAPRRLSGDLQGTPGILLEGPAANVMLDRGVIFPLRHIHMSSGGGSGYSSGMDRATGEQSVMTPVLPEAMNPANEVIGRFRVKTQTHGVRLKL